MRLVRISAYGLLLLVAWLASPVFVVGAEPRTMEVYKSPTCGCCTKWVDHVKRAGYKVTVSDVPDVHVVKRQRGVPESVASCHSAFIGGYFVEGHVPVADIDRLLAEKPDVAGIGVPGMPIGSPGMEGPNPQRYSVFAVAKDGKTTVFAEH